MASWSNLKPVPSGNSIFALISNNLKNGIFMMRGDGTLFKYCHENDEWNEQDITSNDDLPDDFSIFSHLADAVGVHDDNIFILYTNGLLKRLTKANGDQKWRWKSDANSVEIKPAIGSRGIMIKDKFHVIGGWRDGGKHIMFDDETQKFQLLHEFEGEFGLHRLAKGKGSILLFGGEGDINDTDSDLDQIYQYNISENKWELLSVSMPIPLKSFGCVAVLDGRYVILLGGEPTKSNGFYTDAIWIYDIIAQSFKQSRVKCPAPDTEFEAFAICDRRRDKIITFGFVRDSWHKCKMNDMLFPPEYLLRIIWNYYWNEYVYLIDTTRIANHWRISVFDII